MVNITNFIPSPGYILLEITEEDSKLLHAPTAEGPASRGKVLVVGKPHLHSAGKFKIETDVKVGQTIVFKTYGTDTIYLDNKEYKIVPFDGIRGILK